MHPLAAIAFARCTQLKMEHLIYESMRELRSGEKQHLVFLFGPHAEPGAGLVPRPLAHICAGSHTAIQQALHAAAEDLQAV